MLLKIREEKSKKQFNSDHTMFEDKNIMKIEEEKNSIQIGQCLRATVSGRWWSASLLASGMTIDHYYTCKRHFCVGDCFSAPGAFCYL